jgi:hypothetical protein
MNEQYGQSALSSTAGALTDAEAPLFVQPRGERNRRDRDRLALAVLAGAFVALAPVLALISARVI